MSRATTTRVGRRQSIRTPGKARQVRYLKPKDGFEVTIEVSYQESLSGLEDPCKTTKGDEARRILQALERCFDEL